MPLARAAAELDAGFSQRLDVSLEGSDDRTLLVIPFRMLVMHVRVGDGGCFSPRAPSLRKADSKAASAP